MMKEKTKEKRVKWLHLRLEQKEYDLLLQRFNSSTETKLSRFARKVFLAQPINIRHTNASIDALIPILVKVQNDLNGVANNYNQMVHKLHMSDTPQEVKRWLSFYEKEKADLFSSIEKTRMLIAQIAEKWLR